MIKKSAQLTYLLQFNQNHNGISYVTQEKWQKIINSIIWIYEKKNIDRLELEEDKV